MRSSKLYHHIALLDHKEFKAFRRFLHSPYHNRQSNLPDLFDILVEHLFRDSPKPLTEQEAATLLFPDEPFDQNKFRKLSTALLQSCCEFIKYEGLRNDPVRGDLYLLQRLNSREADRYIPLRIDEAVKHIDKSDHPKVRKYDMKVEVGLEAYQSEMRLANRRPETKPEVLVQYVDSSYSIRKMKLLYAQINHYQITGDGSDPGDDPFLPYLSTNIDRMPMEAVAYFHLFQCTTFPDQEASYLKLKELLNRNGSTLDRQSLADLYTGALNYCARAINRGKVSYQRQIWELYREMIRHGMMAQDGKILNSHFKNIMVVAARLGEFEWATDFLQQHEKYFVGSEREIGIHFGRAVISFYSGDLEQAALHFHRVLDDYEDIHFGIDARGYLLRIYFETGNLIGLEALCGSFRMFLKRTRELTGKKKANYNHLINCMRRLARIPDFDKERLRKLRSDIENGRPIANTSWLLKKVDEALAR